MDMTVLERKVRLVTAILNDTNEERFEEMEMFYKNLKKCRRPAEPEPCMYSVEEMKTRLPEIIREFEEGKGVPHETIKRKAVL